MVNLPDNIISAGLKTKDGHDINSLGDAVNNAMQLVEDQSEQLAGVLPKTYTSFADDLLRELLRIFNNKTIDEVGGDVIGRIYEYFLSKFAKAVASDDGVFFTPKSLVKMLVNVLEPKQGVMLDPACGSHYITHIPDFTSVEFTQNASDPILKAKTKPLLDLCNDKEKWFNKGYMIVLYLTLEFVKENDKKLYEKIKFDLEKIDLVYTHTLPSNDIDTINAIVNLSNAGLCNPDVLLQGVSMIPNVNDYLKGMLKYNEYVDKRKEKTNNKNSNSGVNETNLQRQNANPQNKDQEDNMVNATNGQAQNISDNKAE